MSTQLLINAGFTSAAFPAIANLGVPHRLALRDLLAKMPTLRFTVVQEPDTEGVARFALRGNTTTVALQLWHDADQIMVGEAVLAANCGKTLSATWRLDQREWRVNQG